MLGEATSDTGRVVDYTVVHGLTGPDISERVQCYIKEGWQPYGPMTFASGKFKVNSKNGDFVYVQPMVKYAPFVGAIAIRKYTAVNRLNQ